MAALDIDRLLAWAMDFSRSYWAWLTLPPTRLVAFKESTLRSTGWVAPGRVTLAASSVARS